VGYYIPREKDEGPDPYTLRLTKVEAPAVAESVIVPEKIAPEHQKLQGMSVFALFCHLGNAYMVEKILLSLTAVGSEERRMLLERRETSLRLPPLLVVILYSIILCETQAEFEKVADVLLLYGADPFATDVLGRNAIHYATDGKMIASPF